MKMWRILLLIISLAAICSCKAETEPIDAIAQNDSLAVSDSTAVASPMITFLELGSRNCIPCKMMQPVMRQIEAEFGDKIVVRFHDLADDREIGRKYNVRVMPTQIFLDKDGREFFRHEGFYPKEDISAMLNDYLANQKTE